ncbi:hypothetical protein RvY_09156 [Ramazzottius varieornatus]|uniref:RecQ mediated genome instability protein 1 OB-fold domain-containing protein n=1 Tax=Ramazzottius varieornatus TaxID=947166 RepID=A0A1D1VHH5_RAMVA|nr:hypothetical protein RvY_09156 [Ramazzottius varieornatus]
MMDNQQSWKTSLNNDLKNDPLPGLPPNASALSDRQVSAVQYFLQIEEITNILQPSLKQFSEGGKRMLRFRMTDGVQFVTAVENSKTELSPLTPPGTKVFISGSFKISSGFWLLDNQNVKIVGGVVAHMLRAWEIHRDVVVHGKRLGRVDDRPAWVPFGTPLKYSRNGLNFKAMDIVNQAAEKAGNDDDESEEEDEKQREFALQRQQEVSAARGDNAEQLPVLTIGPVDRRPPRLLQITNSYMSAEEPGVTRKLVVNPEKPKEATREVRYNPNNDPGIDEPIRRGRGGGRRGGRGGRGRGRRRGGSGGDDYGDGAPPPRTANLSDYIIQQLGGMSTR